MINDPMFGRPNRHLYPQGPEHAIHSATVQPDTGPTDAPGTAGTASGYTVATPHQVPPLHPHIRDTTQELMPPELLHPYRRPRAGLVVPRFGVLYDSQRTRDGWDKFIDVELEGTVTTAAGTVNTTIQLGNYLNVFTRAMMYPGAVSFYLTIRAFNAAPTTTAGTGIVTWRFQDLNNNFYPLGVINLANSISQSNLATIINTPYTDPTNPVLGTLVATTTTGASFPVYGYQIAFAFCYLLPVQQEGAYVPLDSDDSVRTHESKRIAARDA